MKNAGLLFAVLAASTGAGIVLATRSRSSSAPARPSILPPLVPRPPARGSGSQPSTGRGTIGTMTIGNRPTLESWRTYYLIYGPDVPISASMSWTGEESGGNPCAIGETPPAGAAQPQEYGLTQLNAKDPKNFAIATPTELRAMCGVGPSRAEWEAVVRPLTEAERIKHAVAGIAHIRECRAEALRFMHGWPAFADVNGPNYWAFVKLWHASPLLISYAPVITKQLGRPPASFAEYQAHADAIALANHVGAGHQGGSRGYLDSVWINTGRVYNAVAAAHTAATPAV